MTNTWLESHIYHCLTFTVKTLVAPAAAEDKVTPLSVSHDKTLVTPAAADDKVTPLSVSHDEHTAWFPVCRDCCHLLALLLLHHL